MQAGRRVKTEIKNKKRKKKEILEKYASFDFLKLKIAVLCGASIGEAADYLELFLLERGVAPEFFIGGYNRYYEDAVFGDALFDFSPDVVIINTTRKNLINLPSAVDSEEAALVKLNAEFDRFNAVWSALRKRFSGTIIQNNFEQPFDRVLGSLEASNRSAPVSFTRALNERIAQYARENSGFLVHDIDWLSAREGLNNWHNPTFMHMYKYAIAPSCVPVFAKSLAGLIASAYGKRKKCVVTDLDNTLWGGVIGEGGASSVEIGGGSAIGEAHAEYQAYLKRLSESGILLAIASKNDEDVAMSGFDANGSILKPDDFACVYANWEPKHESIKNIAKTLNIRLDAIVFVDDNPAERELVSRFLPDVSVIDADNPKDFIRELSESGFFDAPSVSSEDAARTQMYRENRMRAEAKSEFSDYSEYLKSLQMKCFFTHICTQNVTRATELINKTNQFNVTASKISESELAAISHNGNWITVCGAIRDKFGDNGIVTVLAGEVEASDLIVKIWVMSCRVFGRTLEHSLLDYLVEICKARGIKRILGVYVPSAKNRPCENVYKELGFTRNNFDDERQLWELAVDESYENKNHAIELEE